jgi:signal transduction histidine kinase
MKSLQARLSALSKGMVVTLAIIQLWVIGFFDYVTEHDVFLSAFYLLPIYWGAWVVGRRAGLGLAVLGAMIWLIADLMSDYVYQHSWTRYWDALTILAFFLVFVYWLTRSHTASLQLEEALQRQTSAVRALQAEIRERELLEAAKLEAERFAVLGRMAAQLAHEIRNPLTAINIRLHSLKKHLAPHGSPQEDALVIGDEIQRLDGVVEDFLLFARPAAPKLLAISADSLLATLRSLFVPQFSGTAIRLHFESAPDTWVRVDPHQIEQVLINLIQNAAESMGDGGTVTVRAGRGTERLNGSGPNVVLEVGDTGPGIPPETRPRIFEPFFTTKEQGTGLGLAIAARIVEKHGGSLACHSVVNKGTTFVILLPSARPERNDESPDHNIID